MCRRLLDSQWSSFSAIFSHCICAHRVCVYLNVMKWFWGQTLHCNSRNKTKAHSGRSIEIMLLFRSRSNYMMQVALVCLMLLPFGWPECVQIFISSLACSMRPIIDTRFSSHIHTTTTTSTTTHNFHVPCEWPVKHFTIERKFIFVFVWLSFVFLCFFLLILRRWIFSFLFFVFGFFSRHIPFRFYSGKILQYFGAMPNLLCWFWFRRMQTQKHRITLI